MKVANNKRYRNMLVYTLVTLAILTLIVLAMTNYVYTSAKYSAEHTLHLQTKEIKGDFELQLASDAENLSTIANVISALHNNGEDIELMFESFEPIGFIENIAVLQPDGILCTKRGRMAVEGLEFDEEIKKGIYISDVVKDVTNPTLDLVRIGVPIVDVDGSTAYMLYGSMLVDTFEERYKPLVDVYDADIWILKNNKIVFSSKKEDHNLQVDFSKIELEENGDEGFFKHIDSISGEEYYGHYSDVKIGTGEIGEWQIVILMPESVVFADANYTINQLMTMFVVIIAVMFAYVIFMTGSIRRHLRISECASKTRKLLLDTTDSEENTRRALSKLCSFVSARSAFFVDSTGEDFSYIKPELSQRLLCDEKRRYFIDTIFSYVENAVKDKSVTVKVYKLFVNKKMKLENPEFYNFLKENGISSIVFAYSVNSDKLITVAGFMNPKVNIAMYILAELAVCISMAVYNRRYVKRIENIAVTDALTGVSNRVACNRDINEYAKDIPEHFACVYVDVNELHSINNKYGHAAGDKMLIFVAGTLKQVFRETQVYRMGGDEFMVFTSNIVKDELLRCVDRVHEIVCSAGYHVSIGVDYYKGHEHIESLVKEAEKRMYVAKAEYYQSKNESRISESTADENYYYMESGVDALDSMLKIAGVRYYGIFKVSLDNNGFETVMAAPEISAYANGCGLFNEFFMKYVYEDVNHDYYRELVNFCQYDVVRKKLSEGEMPSVAYERIDGSAVMLSIYSLKNEGGTDTLWVFEKV